MQRQRFLFAALGLLTLWRWALLPTLELAPDEALAVFRARHGELGGFFESGPLLTLAARLGMLIGGENEMGVRFFAPLLALGASLVVWRLACDLHDEHVAGWAVVGVNVLPAFNLAALSLTPAIFACVLVPGAALCLHRAMHLAGPVQRMWWAAAACVAGTALAQPPAFATMAAVVLVFVLSGRLRHHLQTSGFRGILAAWSVVVLWWLVWQGLHGWPSFAPGAWLPEWRLLPNLARWCLLASPLLLVFFALAVRMGCAPAVLQSRRGLPVVMLLPLAGIDFFYGPHECWPDAGGAVWMLFAAMVLAHRGTVVRTAVIEAKISLRSIALMLAALQGAFLLQTDLPRTLGLRWGFSPGPDSVTDYGRVFSADPSKALRGWRESARVVSAVLKQTSGEWFVLASDWPLAVELDYYLGQAEPVRSPVDDLRSLKGRSALYVTEDRDAKAVPDSLKARFQRTELLSVARVMHAGNEVRWLKIFACHDYRTPDL